ncbi:unnamed protein product [Nezara viridula]|uniref:Uncharacterized protein n=1 Tax=Nezara viridula TaxID=85310 RepID=A0A9P0E6L0_NEZVI|nr:unnamed protein product [Nezara viridula]
MATLLLDRLETFPHIPGPLSCGVGRTGATRRRKKKYNRKEIGVFLWQPLDTLPPGLEIGNYPSQLGSSTWSQVKTPLCLVLCALSSETVASCPTTYPVTVPGD